MNTLDCGCQFGTDGDAFIFKPCSETCEHYLYVLDESARQNKPLFKRNARDS